MRAVRSATVVVLAALALAGCERSKVVIELKWAQGAIEECHLIERDASAAGHHGEGNAPRKVSVEVGLLGG